MTRKNQTGNRQPLRDARGNEVYVHGRQVYELKIDAPDKKAVDLQLENYRKAHDKKKH